MYLPRYTRGEAYVAIFLTIGQKGTGIEFLEDYNLETNLHWHLFGFGNRFGVIFFSPVISSHLLQSIKFFHNIINLENNGSNEIVSL